MLPSQNDLILVTGASGFIGSHIVSAFLERGLRVRGVDIIDRDSVLHNPNYEFILGNLCDPALCRQVVRGVHTVLHFAANMGGMGTIHEGNDFAIYKENHSMVVNLMLAAKETQVKQLLFASSACVYPESLQGDPTKDVSLREDDVWKSTPPKPQGLYGLEKLVSELVLNQFTSSMSIRIARFHNVYGPRGAWDNGREKAPAAFLRKALAIKLSDAPGSSTMEIWGDGTQRRSFLYISDCVDAVFRLLECDVSQAVNIGSSESVTIQTLAQLSLKVAGVDSTKVEFKYEVERPIGVASRNSNNDNACKLLDWQPSTSLEDGLRMTVGWMRTEIEEIVASSAFKDVTLQGFSKSTLVDLQSEKITFAILLPITSRGGTSPDQCLTSLRHFARSLTRTTWRDVNQLGGTSYRFIIYLVIDNDDTYLLNSGSEQNRAEVTLRSEGIMDVVTLLSTLPKGQICRLWRMAAKKAFQGGCDYFVLLGDDVTLKDEGWMRDAHEEFATIARRTGAPLGFGCVAFTDISFPGMPTFPIIHKTHLDIFGGEVVPSSFVNQDGDPYLFQLYRRWGCQAMFPSRIENAVGGSGEARYTKYHAANWTFDTLRKSAEDVESWLRRGNHNLARKLSLDVVVPCYRVQIKLLDNILALRASPTCTILFIIIIDDPSSPYISELQAKYGHRADVRIRVNETNIGASESRNRGVRESAAEYVIYLDDDIVPRANILVEAEKCIRAHPTAAGFVGNSQFPPAHNIFTSAVHVAGVTFFWDIATKSGIIDIDDVPWGVTANLIARRDVKDGVFFDTSFPKTGGGEDIAYCRDKRDYSLNHGGVGFVAAPNVVVTHPWWSNGRRSYRRFYMWSYGDGGLVKRYPDLTYLDYSPNSAELLLLCVVAIMCGLALGASGSSWKVLCLAVKGTIAVMMSNIVHDCYRHLIRDRERLVSVNTRVSPAVWPIVVVESSLIRMASEMGRLVGMVTRGEIVLLGRRFDWFAGTVGMGPRMEERRNNLQRLGLSLAFLTYILNYLS